MKKRYLIVKSHEDDIKHQKSSAYKLSEVSKPVVLKDMNWPVLIKNSRHFSGTVWLGTTSLRPMGKSDILTDLLKLLAIFIPNLKIFLWLLQQ